MFPPLTADFLGRRLYAVQRLVSDAVREPRLKGSDSASIFAGTAAYVVPINLLAQ
jgi:hypothetical protein